MVRHQQISVPYGYELPDETVRGTVIVYDTFAGITAAEANALIRLAEGRSFEAVVFYPLHEETLRRMGIRDAAPYYQRMKLLEEALSETKRRGKIEVRIDQWEGKRKCYTPFETALAFLAEKHRPPFFVALQGDLANRIAGFASFAELIRKYRLWIVSPFTENVHPALSKHLTRWEAIDLQSFEWLKQ